MCKRGLTRDACPGEAITRRAAGAGHERRPERPRCLFLSSTSPSCLLHRTRVPCPRSCAPTSFIRAPKSPSGGVEPPRRLNLPASASNLGPRIPPSPLWAPLPPPRISSSCCCSPYVSPRKRKRERESPVERNINNKVKRIGKRHARNVKLIQSAKQVEV